MSRATLATPSAPAWAVRELSHPVTMVHGTTYSSEVKAVAVWITSYGDIHEWPQATQDNRLSRVLARIRKHNLGEPVALVVVTV